MLEELRLNTVHTEAAQDGKLKQGDDVVHYLPVRSLRLIKATVF
jgi:hypothetical protein